MAPAQSRQLSAFMHLSLDGYFCDPRGDMSFAHKAPDDAEWQKFVAENAAGSGVLVFGRTTYDMMAAWWPTPAAAKAMPEVAAQMNAVSKIVFSRTLTSADWNKTTLIKNDLVRTISRMKAEPGPDMTILGSGSIVTQLAGAGLIDTIRIVVNPVVLGAGKSFLAGLRQSLNLTFTHARTFENGSVVLWYAAKGTVHKPRT
jgi:dihydrofolate reductase